MAQPAGRVEEGALDAQQLEGGVAELASSPHARHREDVGALEESIGQHFDVVHAGSPGQSLGHQARHVAALEGRLTRRQSLGAGQAIEELIDLTRARGPPDPSPKRWSSGPPPPSAPSRARRPGPANAAAVPPLWHRRRRPLWPSG